ncbi:protein NLRC3-like isoform X1 [Poecilia latipinna]|uniref:protein NLRC3-like isoform X1 n=1 Tax=Poecilia latipinna TaxID=48699 RepID=UPI00072EBEE9|nr:PREDICTED: protein NLRC3-like isoform X1 [Poecilia latipinna]
MGNRCSGARRDKEMRKGSCKKDKRNDDSDKKKSGDICSAAQSSHLKDVKDEMETLKEETFSSETKDSTENFISLANDASHEIHNPSSSKLESDEEKATWVDSNMPELIQSVVPVMPIADQILKLKIIHKETYDQIEASPVNQDRMRKLFRALNSPKAKAAFYDILGKIQPQTCGTEDIIKNVIKNNKEYLRKKCAWELEGTEKDHKEIKLLDQIYTEVHIVQGENEHVNKQHEIWEIEDKFRTQATEGIKINCNNIFQSGPEMRAIRTVMTKGIAGIGKTVSVKKFILDWADGKANPDLDFIFMIPFRELNLVKDDEFSLETLVKEFHPELKNTAVNKIFADNKVLFIFDGLDESQLKLNFLKTKRLTDPTKESSVDILVTNLIREHLLPSALVWITSRPGAVQRIPKEYVHQWTEIKGFNDPQKILYFRNRVQNKMVAEQIIDHITTSRSLFIMCHIPIFCWIASKVLEYLLSKMENGREKTTKIPTTLIEMYTHFFCIQIKIAAEKYDKENELDITEIFRLNEDFIFKLGRMAFEKLNKGEIIFSSDDLKSYDIDTKKAGVDCGLCTTIFKEESIFHSKKLYCFVHLTIQEYFAALFVYRSFASKTINSQSLKDFLLIGSEEELKETLDVHPVDLPLDELMEIAIANSTLRKTGELDMFLRFLIGMSLESTQNQLQGLIQQTEKHSEVVEEIRTSITEIDLLDCSPDRCLNLVHCLAELKDDSLYDSVRKFLNPNQYPETELTPVQCSALADLMLMSTTPIEEFDLTKYTTKEKGSFRIIPAVRNCRKARISGADLNPWLCETISSALWSPRSPLTELHLVHNTFYEKGTGVLIDGLTNSPCKLEALSLSGHGLSTSLAEELASAVKSIIANIRELELSENVLRNSLLPVISEALQCQKLEKLRLNRNYEIQQICNKIVKAFTTNSTNLRELELNYTNFADSEVEILSTALMSTSCALETLRLSHNKLTEKGCETLALALTSRPTPLRELDLSYNDLHDSGVETFCRALTSSHCGLEILRLSFCKVTEDGCSSLAKALMSDHCNLRELDLSFNHLTKQGVKTLMEKQRDSNCSLENLNVDHNEECWVNHKLLRRYACDLTLDENTAGRTITLTQDNKQAHFHQEKQHYPYHPDRFDSSQILCKEGLTERHYWEVEFHRLSDGEVGVAYKSITRSGDSSPEYSLGQNEKSWSWSIDGTFSHSGSTEWFLTEFKTLSLGVYLDWPAGILSFFEVSPDELTHLYTVRTTFTEPLYPGFGLTYGSMYIKETEMEERMN